MRGGLDETLARLARREEARRRRTTEPGEDADRDGSTVAFEATGRNGTPGGPDRVGPARTRPDRAGPAGPAGIGLAPVAEVAEAVRRVVAAHPGLSVVLRVAYEGRTYPLRVDRTDAEARVDADNLTTPPPAWPLSGRTVPAWTPAPGGPDIDPAARLAELIRRDPSLLGDDR
ncbi:hypothetical protein [Micromonospora sp. NPDC092111]|uniref:hypothetical protein n=1 Tax=Micromonospora sp. NPDC092111 TaxID=3364289 RepID=UPI00382BD355